MARVLLGSSVAAAAGILVAMLVTSSLTPYESQLPDLTLIWCRDYPALVVAEASEVPPVVEDASRYGEQERLWRADDPGGHDDACRAAFVRWMGQLPSAGAPLPEEPPNWHVASQRYLAPSETGEDGWLVVYDAEVWRCDQIGDVGVPARADFDCRLDPRAPLPSPGTY
jgi:hypothetical protein